MGQLADLAQFDHTGFFSPLRYFYDFDRCLWPVAFRSDFRESLKSVNIKWIFLGIGFPDFVSSTVFLSVACVFPTLNVR